MTKKNQNFAKRFNQLVDTHKLTIRKIASITGLSTASVHSLMNGSLTTDYEALHKFADHCEVNFEWLLTGKNSSVSNIESIFGAQEQIFDGYLKVKIERMIPTQIVKLKKGDKDDN